MDYVQKASIISKKGGTVMCGKKPAIVILHSQCLSASVLLAYFLTSYGLLKFFLWSLLSGYLYSAPNIKGSWDKVFFKGHCELKVWIFSYQWS